MGEFGFVIVALANNHNLLSPEIVTSMIGIGVFSMAITPIIIHRLKPLVDAIIRTPDPIEQIESQRIPKGDGLENQVLICGFGRTGQTISRFLDAEGITRIAVDNDRCVFGKQWLAERAFILVTVLVKILRAVGAED